MVCDERHQRGAAGVVGYRAGRFTLGQAGRHIRRPLSRRTLSLGGIAGSNGSRGWRIRCGLGQGARPPRAERRFLRPKRARLAGSRSAVDIPREVPEDCVPRPGLGPLPANAEPDRRVGRPLTQRLGVLRPARVHQTGAVPISPLRVTSPASSLSDSPSVPVGRRGMTMYCDSNRRPTPARPTGLGPARPRFRDEVAATVAAMSR